MIEIRTCPDAERLRDLLDDLLSQEEQAQWDRHLENCANCQQRLESLAAGTETWTAAARNLYAGMAAPEAGLERVMAESKWDEPAEAETPPADTALDFLSPPDDPAHLGRLGDYQILSVIGRGGMSVVLKAFDPSLHRVVAIKVLAPQLATSAAARTRFQREGYAAAAISHEHVVGVYGVDQVNGLPYLVMEYISGESLQERLDRSGPLELKEVLRIGMQTAQGLAAAHAQGLVHRDIKPANILLHNGVARVKITDFGLARAVDDATLTQSGLIAGTPQYMSPEQARGDAIDARTDLFSLGSVLYAMSAGRPPFRASTTMGVLKRVSDESPRAVREVNAEVPPWLADIIAKLHAKNPANRFQSAAEVAELLARHLAEVQQTRGTAFLGRPDDGLEAVSKPSRSGVPPLQTRKRRDAASTAGVLKRPLGRPSYVKARKRPWAIAAAMLPIIAGMFVVSEATGVTNVTEYMATVLRIKTPEGTLIVETDDPGIEVAVDGEHITIHGAGPKEIRVRAGDHRIRATKDGKEVSVSEPLVTVTRGGKTIVRIRQETKQGQTRAPDPRPPVTGIWSRSRVDIDANKLKPDPTIPIEEKAERQIIHVRVRMENGKPVYRIEGWVIDEINLKSELSRYVKFLKRTELSLAADADVPHSSVVAVQNAAKEAGIHRVHIGEPDRSKAVPQAFRELVVLRGHQVVVGSLAFTPDGKSLVSGEGGPGGQNDRVADPISGQITLWDIASAVDRARPPLPTQGGEVWSYKTSSAIHATAVSAGGRNLATAEDNGTVQLRETETGQVRAIFRGHKGPVYTVAFDPNGQTLASAGLDRTVKIWVVGQKSLLQSFDSGNAKQVNCLAFSPDGKTLAVGGQEADASLAGESGSYPQTVHKARLFTVGSWKVRAVLAGHKGPIRQLAFSPDGKLLATAGDDRSVRLWDVGTGKELAVLGPPYMRNKIRCLVFSPDGTRLATGGEQWATIWKIQPQPGMPGVARKSQSNVFSIAFSPDGKLLAFGCADGSIKLWRAP